MATGRSNHSGGPVPVLLHGQRVVRLPGQLHVHTRPARHSHVCLQNDFQFYCLLILFLGTFCSLWAPLTALGVFLSQQYSSEDALPEHEEADRLQSFLRMQVSVYFIFHSLWFKCSVPNVAALLSIASHKLHIWRGELMSSVEVNVKGSLLLSTQADKSGTVRGLKFCSKIRTVQLFSIL